VACSAANREIAGGAGERAEAGRQVVCGFEAAGLGCVLRGCDGLAGESPGRVMTKQPRSWWSAEGETRPSKRHDKVALGGEQVIGLHDEESL
jgi:hypothetical protein